MIIVHPSLPTGFSSRERVWLRGGLASLLVLAATSAVFAQQAPVDPGDATGIQTTAIQPASTLQVNVRRVVVDVVVTDDHGVPVKNLARTDFRVFEDGKPQTLRSFEQHLAETQPPLPKPDLPPDTFSNLSSVPQSGPVTVILYDLLNTPLESQAFAHEQLLNFLRHRQSSSQVAIFVLTDKLHMLQGFTDDDNQLIAALNSQNGQRYKSSQLQAPGEATQQSDSLSRTAGNQNGADADKNASFQQVSTMLKHMETIESSALLDQRVRITVDALQEISRFLIAIPGRKNLLWLSGSFPTGVLPDDSLDSRDSFDVTRNYSETVVQATDMLNLSHVAVYPVDVRGLQVNPMFTADNNQTYEPGTNKEQQAVRNFNQHVDADHATMDGIADQTGGRAFYNTNGLAQAVATAMQDGAVYYTLSYQPTNTKLDGGVRHVRVELTVPGYEVDYRRTYFADNLDIAVAASEDAPTDAMTVTMGHGAPAAHELFFEAHLQTLGPPALATPEQKTVLEQNETTDAKGKHKATLLDRTPVMMQRYIITYGLLTRQLEMPTTPDGVHHANLEFAAVSYDSDGLKLNGIRSKVQDAIPPDRYARSQSDGYQVVQTVAVPVQAASLRLGIRDAATNHMGSIEVHLPLNPTP